MNTNRFRHPSSDDDAAFLALATDAIEQQIVAEGPETVAAVYLEPVQNAGGCFVPPAGYFARVREICDRHGVLLVSDEVICAFGRLGTMFGCERYDYLPDIDHHREGAHERLLATRRRDLSRLPRRALPLGYHELPARHHLRRAPGELCGRAAQPELFEEERVLDNVRENEAALRARIESLREVPIVGDVRGAGYFLALELVADPDTRRPLHQGPERGAAPRLPLAAPLRGGPDLSHRRPG